MIRACRFSCLLATSLLLLGSTHSAQATQQALQTIVGGNGQDPVTISLRSGEYSIFPSYVECFRLLETKGQTPRLHELNLDYTLD